ncbi:MAG: hypothetical protein F4106_00295 [Gemmatimonadetes bacterium]|nr:hypothetical protein [Gemmatimonadota bacterium]MXX70731.1 hypothetical protein [Gemmatimonadota bacterium]MYC91491.1 hypothetical protein [Gemmatimonadota bacterium]MYG34769.1 hypothetical protein [Gemmatimonadota bacterium]MYJ16491.1 hypothetical protein [Gemmatimonadota bacterium]
MSGSSSDGPFPARRGAVLLAAAAAASITLPSPAAAQNTEWNRYTLEDLVGVYVRAETNQGCEGAGLSAESIRTDAESALEAAEVPLLTEREMLESPGLPELRVTLECGGGVAGVVGYSVSVRMQQATQMIRDNQITLSEAVTWWTTGVGVAEAGTVSDALDAELQARLTVFAEAFAAANAEEEGSG